MPHDAKTRWPLGDALKVANVLAIVLEPVCVRVAVAGSCRRQKPDVGDIELVYIPKVERRPWGLGLETEEVNLTELAIKQMIEAGTLAPRKNCNGSVCLGQHNKLLVHVATGIPVDLFATTEPAWHNYMVCRTGPADSNTRIATEARRQGMQWHPYAAGFTRLSTGETVTVAREEDVFAIVGLPYRLPWER